MATRSGAPILEVLALFVLVFLLQTLAAFGGAMAGLFVLSPPVTADPWTIVTSVYAHAGIGHLLSNAVALVLFGWPVARATTRLRFHTFFLATGAIAGVTQILVGGWLSAFPGFGASAGVLGASGAVFALLGYLLAANRVTSGLGSLVDLSTTAALLLGLALAVVVTLATAAPGVALLAHFTGFVLGLAAGRAGVLEPRSQSAATQTPV
ncbi:rhomboid family intramembrane serine protease [Halobacteria archaeon AArc-dxtr1]|nr:rhomboid family intramembrane serine protease [Halobacteria archaeon AArc-dxtr1]